MMNSTHLRLAELPAIGRVIRPSCKASLFGGFAGMDVTSVFFVTSSPPSLSPPPRANDLDKTKQSILGSFSRRLFGTSAA